MSELFTIIQSIMKCQKSKQEVELNLKEGKRIIGFISDFSGKELKINGSIIPVDEVISIEEKKKNPFDDYIMKRVEIITRYVGKIDAVLVSIDDEKISFITEKGQETIQKTHIEKVICDEKVVFNQKDDDLSRSEAEPESIVKEAYTIEKEDSSINSEEQCTDNRIKEETILDNDSVHHGVQSIPYEPNDFEEGLIRGKQSVVGSFVSHDVRLQSLGYSEKEIERIKKAYKNAGWGTDLYSIATRINQFQLNKNGLAKQYFEKSLKSCKKGSSEYVKTLNVLEQIYLENGDEEYISFWKKNSTYLKENMAFCNNLLSAYIRSRGIKVNSFETAIINGEKKNVSELVSDKAAMEKMGYTSEDIERIGKALKSSNWDVSWYKTATRLFGMQLNKDGLAEVYYEAALVIAKKKSDEYTKILNALASIKTGQDSESYILFFNTYREKLKTNVSFCMTYANALLAVQNWSKLTKDLPMLREQLASFPVFLDKLEEEIEYYKSLPPFELGNFTVLSNRIKNPDNLYDQEKSLIERLPDKNAIKALLDVYFFNRNEEAYYELLRYALFFVKEDKMSMAKLCSMLTETTDRDAVIYYMEQIPVFWCNDGLVKKYLKAKGVDDPSGLSLDNSRIGAHLRSVIAYKAPNGFENSIINCDYESLKGYIENTDLLEEMGYSDSEIEDIKSIDIEQQLSEDYYTMRRILAFQGNKNNQAEQYLFEAYYSNKIDMCNRLFPLLLSEKRGELVLSLFEFDHSLNSKLPSLKRLYYLALCMAENDDDVFFESIESEWMNYPEDIILERMLGIARERKDDFLVKQIEIQKNKPRGNEFETAIIEANNDVIRKYIKSANLLVELGYTPEEIQKINKIFALGSNNGTKPGQIANRVYLYQKNKNNLAERLFLNAITEDSPEDVINDCKALYQIYIGQHNYEMVCKIYEDYLHEEMGDKFNGAYASSYCVALYELERYRDFLVYYKENHERWDSFTLYTNLLYVCEVLDVHEYDNLIWDNIKLMLYRPDIVARYVKTVLDKDIERIYSEKTIDLINMFFVRFSDEDIIEIKNKIKDINIQRVVLPSGGLIVSLVSDSNKGEIIDKWIDYVGVLFDVNTKIDLLIKLAGVFPEESKVIVNKAINAYQNLEREGISEYKIEALEELISHSISGSGEIEAWCNAQAKLLHDGKGTLKSLSNYLIVSQSIDNKTDFWEVYHAFKDHSVSELKVDALFDVAWHYYESIRDKDNPELKKEIVSELIELSEGFDLDYIGCKNMSVICAECGMRFESNVYLQASNRLVGNENDLSISTRVGADDSIDYYEYLLEKLRADIYVDYSSLFNGWSKYLAISEDELLVIDRLRNTVKKSELWVREEIVVISKAIICEPSNYLYWKLLRTWVEKNEDNNEIIIGNILFQISSQGPREQENALGYAVEVGLKDIALDLLMKMLDIHVLDTNIAAQKNLRSMVNKNWFSVAEYRSKTTEILVKIRDNITLSDEEDFLWNSVCAATDLAIATEEYEYFIDCFSEYLSKNCAKQCCVIIADMMLKNKMNGIDAAFDCLNKVLLEIPYKNLVQDLFESRKGRDLFDYEKMALDCIKKDYGNSLGVNDLLGFYCEMALSNMKQCGLKTIELLLKYAKYDPVLYEVAACFLRDAKSLEENELYYNYMYDYLETIQNNNLVEYMVGSMVCGENYLRLNGKKIRAFKRIIYERYSENADLVKKYQEFCDSIIVGLRTTEYEDFAQLLFRAVFSGDWVDVFEYKSDDNTVNSLLRNSIKTDRINVADDYFRSVIKGIALFVLNHSNNMWDFIDNSDRARMLWGNIGNVGCDFDYFTNTIQAIATDEEAEVELNRIWRLDIETLTVYKKFFGKCILSQKYCSRYPEVFNVFINARGGDLFTNVETQEYLKSIDKSKAIDICENYERLYINEPVTYFNKKSLVIKDSDYETNVFSNYLKRNSLDYYSVGKRYERFKKKYELIAQMRNVSSLQNANDERFDFNEKRQIFSVRALYYYYSVLVGEIDDDVFKPENKTIETINAITMALSDDSYISELGLFASKLNDVIRTMIGVLILVEQDKIDDAARIAIESFSGKDRGYLCAKLVASYGKGGKNKDLCRQCLEIAKSSKINNSYWLKNYKHGKSINKLEAVTYLSKKDVSGEFEKKTTPSVSQSGVVDEDSRNFESLSVDTSDEKIDEEMPLDIPVFIKNFIEKDYEDVQLSKYKNAWKKAKADLDNGTGSQESLSEVSINIGIYLIKQQNAKVDESIMRDTFCMIQKYSIQDAYLIAALHDVFQKYVSEFADLDSLAASIYKNRESIMHLCYEQDMNQKSRVSQDIEAATVLIEILTSIANDLSSTMGEEPIKERLRTYQNELFKRTKKVSKFRNASNALGKMIQEKINSINYVPYLVISHLGSASTDNKKNYNWRETWLEGAEKGFVRGVVINRGGAPASRVELSVTVNSELRGSFSIDRIAPGRKIPFVVPYNKNDVANSEVLWGADVSYFDENNEKSHASNVFGKIIVEFSDEEWGISHIGREKFNTQFAAEGEEFCGRTNELLKLENLYNTNNSPDRYPSLLVTGLRRAGKSSVIKFFKEKLRERGNLAPVFVDAQGINGDITNAFFNLTFNELYRFYRKQMEGFVDFKKRWEEISKSSDWIDQLPSYFMELSELLGGRKVIFILDEMENVFYGNHFDNVQQEEQFFGMIRSIIQNYQEFVSFIFCGSDKLLTSCLEQKRESQMFQVLQRIYVGRMSINDIRDMFDKYNKEYDIKFGDHAIDSIMYYTNGLIWYTKVIAYNILDRIVDQEHIIREEIHVSDVDTIVELLIKGDLGAELIDLLDNNFGAKRKAIIRAMARATSKPNDSINADMILSELNKQNYVDNDTGEVLGSMAMDDLRKNLNVLEKMDFIVKDPHQEDSYCFSTELYRLLMLADRKIDKFVKSRG